MTKRKCIWKEKNIFLVTHDLQNGVEFKHKSTTSLPLAKRDKKLFWVESRIEKKKNKGAFTNYVDKILAFCDRLPTPCWHWWRNSFSFTVKRENLHIVDISTTTYWLSVEVSIPEFARITVGDLRSGLTNGNVFILGLVYIMSCLRGECRSATDLLVVGPPSL